MKLEHLGDRVTEYTQSIEAVVEKKTLWDSTTKDLLRNTLKAVVAKFELGWRVQELDWLLNNEAINITFEAFPASLISKTDTCPTYSFLPGGTLIFTQSYTGDVYVFITFPKTDGVPPDNGSKDLGFFHPKNINEKLIIEKVDEFLKEMTAWDQPSIKNRMGYQN